MRRMKQVNRLTGITLGSINANLNTEGFDEDYPREAPFEISLDHKVADVSVCFSMADLATAILQDRADDHSVDLEETTIWFGPETGDAIEAAKADLRKALEILESIENVGGHTWEVKK